MEGCGCGCRGRWKGLVMGCKWELLRGGRGGGGG